VGGIIKIDKLPPGETEAKIIRINVTIGQIFPKGQELLEMEGQKSSIPLKAKTEGIVKKIVVSVGDVVKAGDCLLEYSQLKSEEMAVSEEAQPIRNAFRQCDVAIIGGGTGGYVAAIKAAQLGSKVILIERDKLGGTCLNRGCIPTKALVASASIYETLKNSTMYGIEASPARINIKNVIARKNNIVNQLGNGISHLMSKNNIEIIHGTGKITNKNTVTVESGAGIITVAAKNIIIATGSAPAKPPIPGIATEGVLYSDDLLDRQEFPEKMLIVGGGVIGMEFAFILQSFGVQVTVIEFLPEILAGFDKEVRDEICRFAENSGISIIADAKVKEIIKCENEQLVVAFESKGIMKHLAVDKVLIATGRIPCTQGLGLEEIGVQMLERRKGIKVDGKMQTNIPNIYAIGDVTNVIQLAHVASYQAHVAVSNIFKVGNCEADYSMVPSAIFTNPEVATVGLSEEKGRQAGMEVVTSLFPYAASGKAQTLGEGKGFVKLVADKASKKIIGGSIVGAHATDLIGEVAIVIKFGLTAEQVAETIHAHPTLPEMIQETASALFGKAVHYVG
jgi:dihydrolipoamide dehydrogenase